MRSRISKWFKISFFLSVHSTLLFSLNFPSMFPSLPVQFYLGDWQEVYEKSLILVRRYELPDF